MFQVGQADMAHPAGRYDSVEDVDMEGRNLNGHIFSDILI